SEESTSIKGLKSAGGMLIEGGTFKLNTADDSVHSNLSVTVNGGTFDISAGDDAFHADEALTVNTGTINITDSYEGLEALNVTVNGGDINVVASDDGINAAGGTDSSGMGGVRPGGDMFGGANSKGSIVISGGNIYINASGDGIDANGTLTITGGHVTVCGPTKGDTAVLDYDKTATISGGTFIGTGSSMMAQTISSSNQGVIALSVGNQSAGTKITVTDTDGNVILSYEPKLSFAIFIISTPDIVKGKKYSVTVGSQTGEFKEN
ncbi:MAG: carbohydrate-binding domain-containing protein, partial [Clostridia bacterium]|nr:carbohydrate-binding domain-containing protein [Clostridia bacterium]